MYGCGGGENRDSRRPAPAADQSVDFCQQNPGACDESMSDTDDEQSRTPAVSTEGWTKRACPRSVLDPGSRAPEGVVRAMRAEIPRLITVSAQGRESKLLPENTAVLDVRPLRSDDVALPGIETLRGFSDYYERQARRLCGRTVASRSWGVILQFPEALAVPLSYRVMFFARTAQGWSAWYPRPGP